jgi:hypothetical protein
MTTMPTVGFLGRPADNSTMNRLTIDLPPVRDSSAILAECVAKSPLIDLAAMCGHLCDSFTHSRITVGIRGIVQQGHHFANRKTVAVFVKLE